MKKNMSISFFEEIFDFMKIRHVYKRNFRQFLKRRHAALDASISLKLRNYKVGKVKKIRTIGCYLKKNAQFRMA